MTGDLLLSKCPNDWTYLQELPEGALRHFLFYFRDSTFECAARAWSLDLDGARP